MIDNCLKCNEVLNTRIIKINSWEEDLLLSCNKCNLSFHYNYIDYLLEFKYKDYSLTPNMNLYFNYNIVINIDNFSSKEDKSIEEYMYDCFMRYYENNIFD